MATDPYVNAPRSAITPPEVVRSEAVDLEVVPDHMNPGSPPTVGTDEKFSYHDEKLQTETRVLGLKPLVFWLMTLLVAAILAVGIGAGLGVGLPSRSKSAETTIPTTPVPSVTPSSASPASATSTPSIQPSRSEVTCPVNNTLSYTPASNDPSTSTAYQVNSTTLTYTIHCGFTYDPSTDIEDIQWIPNTNLTTCIDICSIYSAQTPHGGGQYGFYALCSGVTVAKDGTCQLKTGVEPGAKNANKTGDGQSAMLNWYE